MTPVTHGKRLLCYTTAAEKKSLIPCGKFPCVWPLCKIFVTTASVAMVIIANGGMRKYLRLVEGLGLNDVQQKWLTARWTSNQHAWDRAI